MSNHLGDANKMVETPRTSGLLTEILDAYGYIHQGNCPQRWVNHARELERELSAANERIKRLEDIINRAHLAFFSDSSDRKVSIAMHHILDEEVRKEIQ